MIHLDGSHGEGGGQILRTAVGLAARTGAAVTVENIRAHRPRPGLARQHLTAVKAAATLCDAALEGAELGSRRLVFRPGALRSGDFHFVVGTAGSATLVAHTVLPALLGAPGPSRVRLEGGTHNPLAPTFEHLAEAWLPLVRRLGAEVTAVLERPGFEPAGGGAFTLDVTPSAALVPFDLLEPGAHLGTEATAQLANLPFDVARRELAVLRQRLGLSEAQARPRMRPDARGPGNVVEVRARCAALTEVFVAFGRLRVRAEAVAAEAADAFEAWARSGAAVGPHLADQLLVPLALAALDAGVPARFSTTEPTLHTRTQAQTVARFLPVVVALVPPDPARPLRWEIHITPRVDS